MTPCASAVFGVLLALPVKDEAWKDRSARVVAVAIDDAAMSSTEAGLLVSLGFFESGYVERIQAGLCFDWECDPQRLHDGKIHHRARSYWQLQRTSLVPEWKKIVGLERDTVVLAARAARRVVARGLAVCESPRGAASYYAVNHCRWTRASRRGDLAELAARRLSACNYE